jgi:hypothetical protein
VLGCPEVTVTVVTPTPTPEPTQEPTPEPTQGPQDTTPPVVDKTTVTPSTVYTCNGNGATVKTNVTDNVGIVSVTVAWSGATSGTASMVPTGGPAWQFTIVPPEYTNGPVTVVVTAQDAGGNSAAQQSAFSTSTCLY